MTDIFEIKRINEIKEYGVVSVQDIEEGDIIMEEIPLVSSQYLYNADFFPACGNCLKSIELPSQMLSRLSGQLIDAFQNEEVEDKVFCKCGNVFYCSLECQSSDFTHEFLCASKIPSNKYSTYMTAVELWKSFHFPPETCSITLLFKLFIMIAADDKALSDFKDDYFNEKMQKSHHFLKKQFSGNLNALYSLFCDFFDKADFVSKERFNSLFCAMCLNGQGIGTSALESYLQTEDGEEYLDLLDELEDNLDETSGIFTHAEGTGLYKKHSKLNHSCDPNAVIYFPYNNHKLQVVALRDIKQGEEITISYICEEDDNERRKQLEEYYLFSCCCLKCSQ